MALGRKIICNFVFTVRNRDESFITRCGYILGKGRKYIILGAKGEGGSYIFSCIRGGGGIRILFFIKNVSASGDFAPHPRPLITHSLSVSIPSD